MRPLHLTMTAFGPFAGSESIDFAALGENPLFLINGPTGSGKTTILDAICFALYGKTTGDEREGTQMRCDLAAADSLTEVVFAFELQGRRFRIRRVPEQPRPKARGEGTTTQAPEAQLSELLVDGCERLLVAGKVSEATREIEELTGLSVDQFRQVMVLPQGKFRQLLLADSSEREKIFSQLFQTRIFKRLEESLKARAADIRRERERQLQLQQGILEGAEVESAEALERELAELEPESDRARRLTEEKERLFAAAEQALHQARTLREDFARQDQLTAELKQWQERQKQIDSDRQRLQRAEEAGRLQPPFADYRRCETERTQAEKEVEQATTGLATAETQLTEAARQQEDSQPLQAELDRVKQQAGQLESYRTRAETLASARLARQQAAAAVERAELLFRLGILIDGQLLLDELGRLNRQIAKQQGQVHSLTERGSTLRQRYEELEGRAKTLELAWHQGQAAILAAELQSGAPCPVCGSCQHPAPATSAAPLPTQQQVELARQEVRAANEALQSARDRFTEEQSRLRDLQQQRDRCREELGVAADRPGSELEGEMAALRTQAAQWKLSLPAPKRLPTGAREQLRSEVETSKHQAVAAIAQEEAAERELPAAYRESGALERAIAATRKRSDELERQIRRVATEHQQAQNEAVAARTALQAAGQQLQKIQSALQQAETVWQTGLAHSAFADVAEFQGALLDAAQFSTLKTRIAEFDAAGQQLTGALQQLQQQLQGKERPDLVQLETARNAAKGEKQQADESWRQLDKRLSTLVDTRSKLARAAGERQKLDDQYAVVGTLSDVANGQTGNKISLQRFVLSVLLDDVLLEASRRLSLMSKGRYQLLRKEERAKGNRASGLELEVEDAYTGKVRPVATLSGGESFMAALALALGLSEVVQAYAGGIRLDTLFIDEGFGSLDADSLDLAIRTLIDLQASGRMIGIISHVAELKEQMPLRLDVCAGRDGSRVCLVRP